MKKKKENFVKYIYIPFKEYGQQETTDNHHRH